MTRRRLRSRRYLVAYIDFECNSGTNCEETTCNHANERFYIDFKDQRKAQNGTLETLETILLKITPLTLPPIFANLQRAQSYASPAPRNPKRGIYPKKKKKRNDRIQI